MIQIIGAAINGGGMMLNIRKGKICPVFILIPVFLILILPSGMVAGETGPFSPVLEKLGGISREQNEILKKLFILVQDIEEIEREEKLIAEEMAAINKEIKELEAELSEEDRIYQKKRDILKEVLRSYQKSGSGSYLELILDSDSLTMFLRRINALRELTKNTGELLAALEESKDKLAAKRKDLDEKLELMQDKKEQTEKSYREKLQLIEEQEEYLKSLEEEQEFYREYLARLEQSWDELKPTFSKITQEVSRIIKEGDLPTDAMKLTFTLNGLRGTISEDTFNNIIAEHHLLPEMLFRFTPGLIEMSLPRQNLVLTGLFEILEGHILKFEAKAGSFLGLPLSASSLEVLFWENDLIFDLEPLIGKNKLNSIKVRQGYLELEIKPVL
jgi:peptidoglycan hydrolase CwlO-like protein